MMRSAVHGGCSRVAQAAGCDPVYAGSIPVIHPKRRLSNWLARVAVDHVLRAWGFESLPAHARRIDRLVRSRSAKSV